MYYLLYGENDFFSYQKLQAIKNKFLEKNKDIINLLFFEGENFDLVKFSEALSSNSLWQEKKLLIVKNLLSATVAEQQEKILKIIKESEKNNEIIAIFWEKEKLKKTKLFKFLNKPQFAQEFGKLSPIQIRNWIIREFQKYEIVANKEVVSALEFSSNNLWNINNEIQKLSIYASVPKCHPELDSGSHGSTNKNEILKQVQHDNHVTLADFENLATPEVNPNIFHFVDAIAQKNKKAIFDIINSFEKKEEGNENYLLSMITYLFRNLIQIKELQVAGYRQADITKKTKLHPFVVKKTLGQLQNFSLDDLKQTYEKLLAIDTQVKIGRIMPKLALDLLITNI